MIFYYLKILVMFFDYNFYLFIYLFIFVIETINLLNKSGGQVNKRK